MEKIDPAVFHKLYGIKKTRIAYHRRDFLDYLLMIFLSAIAVSFSYGFDHIMSIVGLGLCAFTLAAFIARHGVEFSVPVILRRPQDVLYMFVYKLQNLRPMYFITLGLLLLENVLIAATPNLPHHVHISPRTAPRRHPLRNDRRIGKRIFRRNYAVHAGGAYRILQPCRFFHDQYGGSRS